MIKSSFADQGADLKGMPLQLRSSRAALASGDLCLGTAFQPVMDLCTGRVVAAEALLRATVRGAAVAPTELLEAARRRGDLTELDLAALAGAVRAAAAGGVGLLLVNVEPTTLVRHTARVLEILEDRPSELRVAVEVTERALADDPAGLLRATDLLHRSRIPVALDDVGAEPQSLALLDVIRPSIVKLDMSILRGSSDPATLHVAGAVAGYAEATGARVVAEGIETAADLDRARVLGADLGQGWLWGRPGPAWPGHGGGPDLLLHPAGVPRQRVPGLATPFDLVSRVRPVHEATKDLLVPLTFAVEASAIQAHLPAVLLATVQHVDNVPPSSMARFRQYARGLPVFGVLGEGVSCLDLPDAHLVDLAPDDALALEWTVVALGAQSAVALTAREEPSAVTRDGDRVFSFATTRDRPLVVAAARSLIARLTDPCS